MRFDYDTETLYLDLESEENLILYSEYGHNTLHFYRSNVTCNLFSEKDGKVVLHPITFNSEFNKNHPTISNLFKILHGNLRQRICFVSIDGLEYQLVVREHPYYLQRNIKMSFVALEIL